MASANSWHGSVSEEDPSGQEERSTQSQYENKTMKTLLAIISHPKDNELVARHWKFFRMTGWDILGCGTEDMACIWPEQIARMDTGRMGTRMTPAGSSIFGLVEQELDIWRWFLQHQEYDSVCVVEADNLFTRVPPEHPGGGLYLVTTIPNYASPGIFKTPVYFSTPRWGDRRCIEQMHAHGRGMFERGDVQHWISDRFPAWVCQQGKVPWLPQPAWSPLPFYWNGTVNECWVRDARAAIKIGCYCLHSVKYQWQLDALKDLLPNTINQTIESMTL